MNRTVVVHSRKIERQEAEDSCADPGEIVNLNMIFLDESLNTKNNRSALIKLANDFLASGDELPLVRRSIRQELAPDRSSSDVSR